MDDTTDDTSSTACHVRWTREASRNPVLAAAEIYFMACPGDRLPWRDLLQMSHGRGGTSPEELFARPPPPPEGWAGRRTRRRRSGTALKAAAPVPAEDNSGAAASAAKEPRRMDSPTTPLSWTTAAASSGSGSGSRSAGSEVATRDDDAVTTAAAAAAATTTTVVLPVAGTKRPRRSDAEPTFTATAVVPAPSVCTAVSSSSDAAGTATATAGNSRSVVRGLTDATARGTTTDGAAATGSGGGCASISRTTRLLLGKKMTLVELKSYEQSLLQQNIDMRKELELHRKAQKVLVEENARLKMLKSKHQPQAARQQFVAAKDEAASGGKCPFLPFDLNMPAAEDTVDPGEGFH